ncbi:asparagine synthase [Streptomyces sp. CB02923]|uniref:asparagine synthase n=1 Tax=Streptomyces sp. CB02923 TaxID=1718985 RepID=UPI00093A8181|nr:asparagine synthase [Streptomyces sp. CB02923]OKI09364.1 asparagine synthase [Streptomyces sp. CB02923]
MIKLRLAPYSGGDWQWDGARYTTAGGESEVAPVLHPLVEQAAVSDGRRTLIMVREKIAGHPAPEAAVRQVPEAGYDQARRAAGRWPADWVLTEWTQDEPVQVTAGPCRTTPLYLAADGATLHGSWEMGDLARWAGGLNPRETARLLLYRPRYSSETAFTGIHRLTERATAHFGGALFLRYPEPALHSGPRELAEDADVLGAFVEAMDGAWDLRPLGAVTTALHLTGGVDSGVLATRAAERFPGRFPTAALLIGGPGRAQQIRRRQQIREAVRFADPDLLRDAMVAAPLHRDCARVNAELVSPYDEPLYHPFRKLTEALAAAGTHAVVTGLGGDEMVALSQEEYPHRPMGELTDAARLPWVGEHARSAAEFADIGIAPPAMVNSMTLLSLETTAPLLLRAGIWPVHPFADPVMVQLGEWLPLNWRRLKQLQRRRLAALDLGREVVQPKLRESFAEVVQHTLTVHARPLFARMLRDGSPLFDNKLVNPDGLRRAVDRLRDGAYREDGDAQLLEVTTLHLAAEAFL